MEASIDFEESDPQRSRNDKKKYRLITLKNGLKALLISDNYSYKRKDIGSELHPIDLTDEPIKESEITHKDSKSINEEIPSKINLAAASLCIGVGSFEDNLGVEGLMHYLEHLILKGSKKYPSKDSFDYFISEFGGEIRCRTDLERTIFSFSVLDSKFQEALDRFAQLFISPTIVVEALKTERESIDLEFQNIIEDDDYRRRQLLALVAEKSHVMSRFSFGNDKTLNLQISEEKMHKNLLYKWSQLYSAHFMSLVIQCSEGLEKLELMVKETFSKVPSNNNPKPLHNNRGLPFDEKKSNILIKMASLRDEHILHLSWVFPPLQKHYECKPLQYLAYVIGQEGVGSISSYLKKKLWIGEIFTGSDGSGFEDNSTCTFFNIRITLTESGLANMKEVITVVFQYIQLLQKIKSGSRIYSELQKMERVAFDFAEEKTSLDNVQDLSEDLTLYRPEHTLSGRLQLIKYDYKIIDNCLSKLTPKTVFIISSSKAYHHSEINVKTEKWFGTKYTTEDIPSDWINDWISAKLNPQLQLPVPNLFIPEDFKLLPIDKSAAKHPYVIERSLNGVLWYCQHYEPGLPKASCYIYFKLKEIEKSAEMGTMLDLYLNMFNLNILNGMLFPALMALYDISINAEELGFSVTIDGFSDKIYNCFDMVWSHIKALENKVEQDFFEDVKQQLMCIYRNTQLSPEILRYHKIAACQESYWSVSEKMEVLKDITLNSFISDFIEKMRYEKYTKMIVQGNVKVEVAKRMLYAVVNTQKKNLKRILAPEVINSEQETKKRKLHPEIKAPEVTNPDQEIKRKKVYTEMKTPKVTNADQETKRKKVYTEIKTPEVTNPEQETKRKKVFTEIKALEVTNPDQETKRKEVYTEIKTPEVTNPEQETKRKKVYTEIKAPEVTNPDQETKGKKVCREIKVPEVTNPEQETKRKKVYTEIKAPEVTNPEQETKRKKVYTEIKAPEILVLGDRRLTDFNIHMRVLPANWTARVIWKPNADMKIFLDIIRRFGERRGENSPKIVVFVGLMAEFLENEKQTTKQGAPYSVLTRRKHQLIEIEDLKDRIREMESDVHAVWPQATILWVIPYPVDLVRYFEEVVAKKIPVSGSEYRNIHNKWSHALRSSAVRYARDLEEITALMKDHFHIIPWINTWSIEDMDNFIAYLANEESGSFPQWATVDGLMPTDNTVKELWILIRNYVNKLQGKTLRYPGTSKRRFPPKKTVKRMPRIIRKRFGNRIY